jgi:dTDP-4-amino-4,6-dideoxygalactose transaminase
MITTALSPNLQNDDVWLSIRLLLQPWRWRRGETEQQLNTQLHAYFGTEHIWAVNSGRTALLLLLRSLKLSTNDEVLLQAFTCNAVCNPIQWSGAKPVYVDIDAQTLNMSVIDLAKKITPRSKVIIIQHTFGQPADLTPLLDLAKQHQLIVIEDCAHALGARYQNRLVGTFGDAAIFSFGRDKVISSVYGGAVLVSNPALASTVHSAIQALPYPSRCWTWQQLVHPLITTLSRYIPGLLWIAQRLRIISLAVSRGERMGQKPSYFPAKLPNSLAALALQQFKKLDLYNQHRLQLAKLYQQALPSSLPWSDDSIWLRYSLLVDHPQAVFAQAKQAGMILGDWYWNVVVPVGVQLDQYGYVVGSCPVAERTAKQIINLPTHVRLSAKEANQVIAILKPLLASAL